jgi:spermidine synthase
VTLLLALAFTLSGAAGLIYESIWSRYLGLLVGHSAYAQVIVLVIFLGGMSVGATVVARRSSRLREPLLWYALVELAVGMLGLAFHDVFTRVSALAYGTIFPALAGGTLVVIVKWTLAALLILPQSVLLGATFPLMSAGLIRRLTPAHGDPGAESGHVLGLLYFANSIGAAFGVLVAGFWLLGAVGLPGTLAAAATVNIIVAAVTYLALVALREADVDADAETGAARPASPAPERGLWRLLVAVSFGTAVASFIYEIAWVRMLALVLGSATHAFELMLSAFVLGLALGAFWIHRRADSVRDPVRMLGIVQVAMGVLAIGTLAIYTESFHWMASLILAVDENVTGYALYNVVRYGIAFVVMLPPTFCAGTTLPLITRTLLGAGHGERSIGTVYAWNTFGSIVGVALAALWLMPAIGLRALLIVGGALDIAIGIWLLWRRARTGPDARGLALSASGAGLAVLLGATFAPAFDPGILASGVFRYGSVPERGSRNILFYEDGRTASVSVRLGSDSGYSLATNGKPDASVSRYWFDDVPPDTLRANLRGDESTQVLLPLITLAHAPHAKQAAVIGHGSGISSHFLLGSPELDDLVTIEIEPQMIAASRLFLPVNLRVFDDPRSRFVHDDARSYFASANKRFDLILSEPSNPWVSGVSGLFTDEFYRRVGGYLAPGGVFGQWLHLYEIDDVLVLNVLAALHRNFRSYAMYMTNDVDVLVVASNAARLPEPDWSVFRSPDVAGDLRRFRPLSDAALRGALLATRGELAPLLDSFPHVNSDFQPVLDLGAERTRFLRRSATGFLGLSVDRFDVAAALGGRVVPLEGERRPALSMHRVEAQSLARRLRGGETLASDDTTAANREFQRARLRGQQLAQGLAAGRPPADWFTWFIEMVAVEADRHGGTMGVIDSAWYAGVERFMVAQNAPRDGVSALRLLRAAASYDWRTAARETEVQITARNRGRRWLPADLFFDAAVVSHLRLGEFARARVLFARLSTASDRPADDVRTLLLDAYLSRAESTPRGPAVSPTR